MSDRYAQLVNAPVVSTVATPARAAAAGRRSSALRPGGPRRSTGRLLLRRGPGRAPASEPLDGASLDRIGVERGRRRGQGQGARLRRHRDRRLDRAGRAAALLLPGGRPAASAAAGSSCSARRRRRPARPAPPPRSGRSRASPARSARRSAAAARPRSSCYVAPGGEDAARLDPALPALAALGLRLRPGRRGSATGVAPTPRDRLGAAARGQGRAGHRRLARDRRGDRRRPSPATAPRSSASTCRRPAEDLRRGRRARSAATAIELDITAADAPERDRRRASPSGVDIVVHNAGVTRDRTIAKMPEERWAQLMEINLSSEERIDDALLDGEPAAPPTGASSASPRCRGSPATRARPTTPPRRPA